MEKFNVKALAIAGGVAWGALILFVGLTSTFFSWGNGFVDVMASIYIGFAPTLLGSIIGTLWALVDGALIGALIAWVYNKVSA